MLGQAELLALQVTNTQIHLLDLTAISDTAMAGSISQAWRREMSPGAGSAPSSLTDPKGQEWHLFCLFQDAEGELVSSCSQVV